MVFSSVKLGDVDSIAVYHRRILPEWNWSDLERQCHKVGIASETVRCLVGALSGFSAMERLSCHEIPGKPDFLERILKLMGR